MDSRLLQLLRSEAAPGHPVNSRDLWHSIQTRAKYANWIASIIHRYQLIEEIDFIRHKDLDSSRLGRPPMDFYLSLNAAKHIAYLDDICDKSQLWPVNESSDDDETGPCVLPDATIANWRQSWLGRGLISR